MKRFDVNRSSEGVGQSQGVEASALPGKRPRLVHECTSSRILR